MNKQLKHQLENTQRICTALLAGEKFYVKNQEINAVPKYLNVMTKTAGKRAGLVLKRSAKPVGEWDFQIGTGPERGRGLLYLGSGFKPEGRVKP